MMPLLLLRRKDKPALDLSFMACMPDGVAFARASKGWYFGSDGLLKQAEVDVPRFDWDPETLQPRGLLCEGAHTNRALYCRDFTNTAWVKTGITAALNQTGIDGAANSASLLTASAANATALQTLADTSDVRKFSVYLKRVSGSGAVSITTDGGATWTSASPTSSWKRFSVPYQTLANPVFGIRIATSGDAVAADFAQQQTYVYPTSPIPTTDAAVTVAQDFPTIAAGPWFNALAGTMMSEHATNPTPNTTAYSLSLSVSGTANQVYHYRSNTNVIRASVYADGASQLLISGPSANDGVINKLATSYSGARCALSYIGSAVASGASSGFPSGLNRIHIAHKSASSGASLNGWFRRLRYWSYALDDIALQQVTQ